MTLEGGGWAAPPAYVRNGYSASGKSLFPSRVEFTELRLDALIFSPTAGALVLQGMKIQDFFPPDIAFVQRGVVLLHGPFIYLRGQLSAVHDGPYRIEAPVLAAVNPLSVPMSMSREELLSLLLAALES